MEKKLNSLLKSIYFNSLLRNCIIFLATYMMNWHAKMNHWTKNTLPDACWHKYMLTFSSNKLSGNHGCSVGGKEWRMQRSNYHDFWQNYVASAGLVFLRSGNEKKTGTLPGNQSDWEGRLPFKWEGSWKKQLEQMGSLQLILIASYSRETGQVAQLVNAKRDAPSKLTPFAHVWATSL